MVTARYGVLISTVPVCLALVRFEVYDVVGCRVYVMYRQARLCIPPCGSFGWLVFALCWLFVYCWLWFYMSLRVFGFFFLSGKGTYAIDMCAVL